MLEAMVDGEPPDGGPLVSGTGGGGVNVRDDVVDDGVDVRGWFPMAAANIALEEEGSPIAPPAVRRSLKIIKFY